MDQHCQLRKINESILRVSLYVNTTELSHEEVNAIGVLLDSISAGKANLAITEKLKELTEMRNSNKLFFSKNPHSKIVVVGGCKIRMQVLVGIFQSYGIERRNLQTFTDYDQLKKIFPIPDIRSKNTKSILLGAVPHSVTNLNGYSSPKQAIESSVQDTGAFFMPAPDLNITKEAVIDFIYKTSKHLQSKSP